MSRLNIQYKVIHDNKLQINCSLTTSVFNNFVGKSPVHGVHNYHFTTLHSYTDDNFTTLTSFNFT